MSRHITTTARNIFLLSIVALCQLAFAQTKTVEVTYGQPIAKAVQMLEKIYSVPIAFEDTRYVNEALLEDITTQVQRTPDPSHRIMGLKARTLSFTYKLPPSRPSFVEGGWRRTKQEREADVADALKSVLEGYAAAGGPESFTVVNTNGVFRVTATNFLNTNGKLEQITPILDTKISIPPGQRDSTVLLIEICQTLSKAAGVPVGIWNFPYNGEQTVTSISGSGVTARSLLIQLLAEMDALSSTKYESVETTWSIGGGADLHYFLSFHHVILNDD